jgi:glyoxylase I family protein
MIAKGVHHISFLVSDLERSCRFYEDVLGLARIPRPDFGVPGVWYGAGSSQVHLIGAPEGMDLGARPEQINPMANHQAFEIEDYRKTLDFLKAGNVEVLETKPEVGQMWIRDPDGNVIELIAPSR